MGILDEVAGDSPNQPTQAAPAAAPTSGGSLLDQVASENTAPPATTVATPPPVQKSFLQHAQDASQTTLSNLGIPSTMEEVRAANHMLKGQITHPLSTAGQIVSEGVKGALQPNDVQALQAARAAWDKGDHV